MVVGIADCLNMVDHLGEGLSSPSCSFYPSLDNTFAKQVCPKILTDRNSNNMEMDHAADTHDRDPSFWAPGTVRLQDSKDMTTI
jgi:hypothetical protein